MADELLRRICGVDFSRAKNVGEKIWISSGEIEDSRIHTLRNILNDFSES